MRVGNVNAGAAGSPWVLSPMRADDLPDVLEIERQSFPHPWTGALFLQELRVPFSRVLLARDGRPGSGLVRGYVCRWLVIDEIHVLNVAVHPEHRRHGIATRLVAEVLEEARTSGVTVVTLEVRRGNVAARRLYERLAFEEVGVRRHYYGRGEDALVMRRRLAGG
jgi:ribosomal-protein-alanine N-acetyltransferase